MAVIALFTNRLPNNWTIEKAVLVKASPRQIYSILDSLENWPTWTVWNNQNEASLSFSYPAHRSGVGAVQVWQSARLSGHLTLTKSNLDREIQYEFLLKPSNLLIKGTFAIAAADLEYTQLAWRCVLSPVQSINPVTRYLAHNLRNSFDLDITDSLSNLVSIFEPETQREEK